ncbi:MAG: SpoIIE family protein phosphatase, partial [Deltaproteobacteria bacterium]|nr:SpoIIE family protein phosphatase [Deltaproteobacteria bacterium]
VQGERLLGVLVVGHAIGAPAATELSALLGGRALAIRGHGAVIAAIGEGDPAALATAARGDTLAVGGKTWLVDVAAWPGATGLEVVVLGDLDAALAPAERLQRVLYVVGVAALLIALLVAIALGGALSRPVERLVGFTDKIAAGDLAARAEEKGVRELRQLAARMNAMAGQLDAGRTAIVDRARLADEMALATRIQTSILPREFAVPRLEIAARMDPASEVGGDYYDVLAVPGGAWIGIGDVSGHGLDAGLYALMAQTAVAAVVDARPGAPPREQIAAVNRILRANAWGRLGDVRHMTLCLARFFDDGRVTFAGAHLDLIVVRADGSATAIATPGTWVGIIDDVDDVTVDGALTLAAGDTLVVYSDGVVEAAAASGEHFGLERLTAVARAAASAGPAAVVAQVVAAVAAHRVQQDDDVTVVALRYRGAS